MSTIKQHKQRSQQDTLFSLPLTQRVPLLSLLSSNKVLHKTHKQLKKKKNVHHFLDSQRLIYTCSKPAETARRGCMHAAEKLYPRSSSAGGTTAKRDPMKLMGLLCNHMVALWLCINYRVKNTSEKQFIVDHI